MYSHQQLFILHFHLPLFKLSLSQSINFLFEALDIINRWFKYRSFVWSNISNDFVVWFITFWQQRTKLLNSIIYIKSSSSLNFEVERKFIYYIFLRKAARQINHLLILWLSFFCLSLSVSDTERCGSCLIFASVTEFISYLIASGIES